MKVAMNKFNFGQPSIFLYPENDKERRLLGTVFGNRTFQATVKFDQDKRTQYHDRAGFPAGRVDILCGS